MIDEYSWARILNSYCEELLGVDYRVMRDHANNLYVLSIKRNNQIIRKEESAGQMAAYIENYANFLSKKDE